MSSLNLAFSVSSLHFNVQIKKVEKPAEKTERIYRQQKYIKDLTEKRRMSEATNITFRF